MKWNRCHRIPQTSLLAAGALGEAEKIEMGRHVTDCAECRAHFAEMKSVVEPLGEWKKSLSAIEVTPAARQRWESVLKQESNAAAVRRPVLAAAWRIVWHELIRPSRHAWTGMAALWLAMLVINGSMSGHVASEVGRFAISTQEMQTNWAEQNRVLAELCQPSLGSAASPPTPAVLRPRSERARDWEII